MANPKRNAKIDCTKHQDIIYLYEYFVKINKKRVSLESTTTLYGKVAEILHVSRTSVVRCIKSKSLNKQSTNLVFRPRKVDDFSQEVIRRKIYEMYQKKILPTVPLIQEAISEDIKISNSCLRRVLLQIGFCWRKTTDDRRVVVERPDSKAARANYIRQIKGYRKNGLKIVYLDETWVNAGHCNPYTWLPKLKLVGINGSKEAINNLPKIPPGKGKRLIILHAGCEYGFISNMQLVFEGKKSGDYHSEMNSHVFLEWFERLCVSLPGPSCIVLDNASYHNVRTENTIAPTTASLKATMQNWLKDRHIHFDPCMTKPELYQLIKRNKPSIVYKTDELAWQWGHTVLRTPVRQCELNAIELIWAQVKQYVAKRNTTFKFKDVKMLVTEAFDSVTKESWQKCVSHVMDIEKFYEKTENIMDPIEPVIIHLNSDEEESDDSDSESDTDA